MPDADTVASTVPRWTVVVTTDEPLLLGWIAR